MKSDKIEIRIRYAETDQMGVVHHGNYALYLEMARIEWLRKLGISYKKMEEEGVALPVTSLSVKYKKTIHYDDVITVKTTLKKRPTASIEFDYEILNDSSEVLSTANTVLVFVDLKTNRPTRPPKYILDALEI
ncbi:thioesterase family protein [uncultured Lacinutrix sp.]|uniref:acyl-CoA thioesterase n=1 Tax=uncultured Lacinutrix sp. TaxID=574032 RepID=UPI002624D3E3|nr:thioesterase family protein [uncultured Lacinutrix sp.]